MTTYTAAQTAHIVALAETIENRATQMAVVDYLGFMAQDHFTGRVRKITEFTLTSERFGVRSIAHVVCYKFPVILLNQAARLAQA